MRGNAAVGDQDSGGLLRNDALTNGAASGEPLDTLDLDNPDNMDGIYLEDPAVPLADMKFKLGPIEVDARLLLILIVIIIAMLAVAGSSWWYWKPYLKRVRVQKENLKKEILKNAE